MPLTEDQQLDLVVATLATYSYPLEKAWQLREALRSAGFADPATWLGKKVEEVGNALKAAGYDRGGITYIIAPRVISLMEAVAAGQLDVLGASKTLRSRDTFCAELSKVKGFGPKSSGLAWELMKA